MFVFFFLNGQAGFTARQAKHLFTFPVGKWNFSFDLSAPQVLGINAY